MAVRILQGTGLGIILCTLIGFLLGVTGLGFGLISIVVLTIVTYFPAGYVAARNTHHPYLAAGLSALFVMFINQLTTAVTFGMANPSSFILGFLFGTLLALLGALISHRPWSK